MLVPIGTLCEVTGFTRRQIRYFEETGLLSPVRRGQRRLYSSEDVRRAELIRRWREHGYSLQRIRKLLADMPPATMGPVPGREREKFEDVKLFFRDHP